MTWMSDLTSSGSMPALEMTLRFAGQRQKIIAHNIANLTTPDFRPVDVSPQVFQSTLARAIEERRSRGGLGPLPIGSSREIRQRGDGSLELNPRTPSGGVLAHDRNNRDLERMMQDLAENTAVFRTASDLYKNRSDLLRSAIAQRV
ncbi:MAG: hypothetical protein IT436_07470 [Phycisphaerales bacterium]|nr:hypothetical protein [Phycisphaerales bacterium]